MDIKLSRCFLPIDDHDTAIAFYRDVLGFEVRSDVKYEGMRWTTIGPPSQPDINIILEPPVANPNASPEDKQAIAELMAKGLLGRLDYTVKDVDAAFETVRASGADVLQEPINQPYGVRDCAFRDPAGNEVRFTQPPA
jgi:uncharacterized glyoxalase superfamily protein PhnB